MNELVYRNGQAGINKATVTITFDNSDPRSGPVGYENSRELVVTRQLIANSGTSKYFINGSTCSNIRVQDLFKSIQLNVNNPHFLIMQGRITKVLNMKPMEILSMVEEAVGTHMYEEKKGIALKNLVKWESKLREINTLIDEHICPQLKKLKADKQDYANYTRMKREHEQLSKLHTAWDFARTEEVVLESVKEKVAMHKRLEDLANDIKDTKQEMEDADKRISEIEKQMDSKLKASGKSEDAGASDEDEKLVIDEKPSKDESSHKRKGDHKESKKGKKAKVKKEASADEDENDQSEEDNSKAEKSKKDDKKSGRSKKNKKYDADDEQDKEEEEDDKNDDSDAKPEKEKKSKSKKDKDSKKHKEKHSKNKS